MITLSQASVTPVVMFLQLPDSCLLAASPPSLQEAPFCIFYVEVFEVVTNRNNEDKNRLLLIF